MGDTDDGFPLYGRCIINGLEPCLGYHISECRDAAANILPWNLSSSAVFTVITYQLSQAIGKRNGEFSLSWMWIRLSACCWAWRSPTHGTYCPPHGVNRPGYGCNGGAEQPFFKIMARPRKLVIKPLVSRRC
jgi:hypothetical protein